ncbi:hypothetical protein Nepgr_014375 [Nepenthes gracilis]|uniref:Uncharacterized protein n=1 Tax=Nepenthes gracilis TaxID=150966 RepID=A0AAD3SKT0_NEPGR|nr:hypothetical protein Nepgr_014375 [Nepenthes gracilis]
MISVELPFLLLKLQWLIPMPRMLLDISELLFPVLFTLQGNNLWAILFDAMQDFMPNNPEFDQGKPARISYLARECHQASSSISWLMISNKKLYCPWVPKKTQG